MQKPPQLRQLFRQRHPRAPAVPPPQRRGRLRQPPRPPPHPQIHPPRRQRRQHVKIFRHLIRAVMLQHHPARTHPDPRSTRQQMRHQHLRRRPHHPPRPMMLRHPKPVIPPLLRLPRQMHRPPQSLRRRLQPMHRALIQDPNFQRQNPRPISPTPPPFIPILPPFIPRSPPITLPSPPIPYHPAPAPIIPRPPHSS